MYHMTSVPSFYDYGVCGDSGSRASLSQEQKSKAAIIKEQSLVIKTLIEDLNLTSKLEYDMQPLRLQSTVLALLQVRQLPF